MPCRDYEYDYQEWLKRSRKHLHQMREMLSQLCQEMTNLGKGIPPTVARWWADHGARTEAPLTRKIFDDTAQMLCLLCKEAEKESVTMPPAVAGWWVEHKARDEQPADLGKGLDPTPIYANFWEEHAARESMLSQLPGINHQDAVRALERAGFRVLNQGKVIVMTNGSRKILIPRDDPVNPYTMATIIGLAGLKEEEFRKLL